MSQFAMQLLATQYKRTTSACLEYNAAITFAYKKANKTLL